MSEDLKVRIELLKLRLDVIKSKLLLFSSAFGGIVAIIFNSLTSPISKYLGVALGTFLFIAIIANLFRLGKILSMIDNLEKGVSNG